MMYTGHCYGYGLDGHQLRKIPRENLAAFLRRYSTQLEECNKANNVLENSTDDEVIEYFEAYEGLYSGSGVFCAVCDILYEKMGISLYYADCEDEQAIYMPQMMPWDMTENDLNIHSENDLQILFQPFLNELGIPDEAVGSIDIEWFG